GCRSMAGIMPQERAPGAAARRASEKLRSGQASDQRLRFLLLLGVALLHDLTEEAARHVVVAHVEVGTGEVELGAGLVAARDLAAIGRHLADVEVVELDVGQLEAR